MWGTWRRLSYVSSHRTLLLCGDDPSVINKQMGSRPLISLEHGVFNVCDMLLVSHIFAYVFRENWFLRLWLLCSLMMCTNSRVHYGLMVVYGYLHITIPHHHHYADLSEGNELLKCLSDIFFLGCVSKIISVLSITFHAIYGTVWIQLTHFSYDNCENTYALSYYHHQIGCMTYLLLSKTPPEFQQGRTALNSYLAPWRFRKICWLDALLLSM